MNHRVSLVTALVTALVFLPVLPRAQAAPLPSQGSTADQTAVTLKPTIVIPVSAQGLTPDQLKALASLDAKALAAYYGSEGDTSEIWTTRTAVLLGLCIAALIVVIVATSS